MREIKRESDFTLARGGATRTDSFGYNARSELTSATLGSDAYAYAFDNVGNRGAATEAGTQFAYVTNELNQYPALTKTPAEGQTQYFTPTYDADGNAVLIWTETGVWVVSYNAQNRPVSFRNDATDTLVECAYDYRGRRCTKKVTVAGTVVLHQRYIYREYLQIACVDLTRAAHPALWLVLWDPTQPTATRPLAIQKDGSWFTYGYDVTKNVWEVFGPSGYVRTSYDYAPFGAVSATGDVTQPFQWSSEVYDSELGLVYYNYRHYSPTDGRFLSRDPIGEQGGRNLYCFVGNNSVSNEEFLGLKRNLPCCGGKEYNPKIKCCINEKLVSRQGTATIVLKLGHNYSARDDFREKRPGAKEKWGYVCCTGKSVNDEFISLPASGIPDHKNCRTDCFIYPQGDDVETKSVETAYQEELENATIEAKASCEQDCVKNVRISVRSLDKYGKEWMENRKPSLANGGVVKIVSCTRG